MDGNPERTYAFTYAIPTGALMGDHPWRCARELDHPKTGMICGCPKCLHDVDLTMVWSPTEQPGDTSGGFRVCAIATAKLDPKRICPGYWAYLVGLRD